VKAQGVSPKMWWLGVEAAEGWPTEAAFGPEYTPFRYRAAAPRPYRRQRGVLRPGSPVATGGEVTLVVCWGRLKRANAITLGPPHGVGVFVTTATAAVILVIVAIVSEWRHSGPSSLGACPTFYRGAPCVRSSMAPPW
jgi:hypothetical protein